MSQSALQFTQSIWVQGTDSREALIKGQVTEERLYQHVMTKTGVSDSKILKYCADVLQKSKKICFHFVPLKRARVSQGSRVRAPVEECA